MGPEPYGRSGPHRLLAISKATESTEEDFPCVMT
jgi:hypothetical protein